MREILLSGEIMDVVYYTNMIARNTVMANGDYEYLPYAMLLDAAIAPRAATPKELARVMGADKRLLESAAAQLEADSLVIRTRSPLDRRSPGYTATAEGARHARGVNLLMREVAFNFWDIDEAGFERLIATVEPFQREEPHTWFESSGYPTTLRSLCALYALWDDYVRFAHKHMLSFSEMHMLLVTEQFGPQPARALYQDRNQFAVNDFAANEMMARDSGLMRLASGHFELSERGRDRIALMRADCGPASPHHGSGFDQREADEALAALCHDMTSHAMADGLDDYRGTRPHLPRVHEFSEAPRARDGA